MWELPPTGNPKTVFVSLHLVVPARQILTLYTAGAWGSFGGSAVVGRLLGILPLLGADAAVHMSEEVEDAGRVLPRKACPRGPPPTT